MKSYNFTRKKIQKVKFFSCLISKTNKKKKTQKTKNKQQKKKNFAYIEFCLDLFDFSI